MIPARCAGAHNTLKNCIFRDVVSVLEEIIGPISIDDKLQIDNYFGSEGRITTKDLLLKKSYI